MLSFASSNIDDYGVPSYCPEAMQINGIVKSCMEFLMDTIERSLTEFVNENRNLNLRSLSNNCWFIFSVRMIDKRVCNIDNKSILKGEVTNGNTPNFLSSSENVVKSIVDGVKFAIRRSEVLETLAKHCINMKNYSDCAVIKINKDSTNHYEASVHFGVYI